MNNNQNDSFSQFRRNNEAKYPNFTQEDWDAVEAGVASRMAEFEAELDLARAEDDKRIAKYKTQAFLTLFVILVPFGLFMLNRVHDIDVQYRVLHHEVNVK